MLWSICLNSPPFFRYFYANYSYWTIHVFFVTLMHVFLPNHCRFYQFLSIPRCFFVSCYSNCLYSSTRVFCCYVYARFSFETWLSLKSTKFLEQVLVILPQFASVFMFFYSVYPFFIVEAKLGWISWSSFHQFVSIGGCFWTNCLFWPHSCLLLRIRTLVSHVFLRLNSPKTFLMQSGQILLYLGTGFLT